MADLMNYLVAWQTRCLELSSLLLALPTKLSDMAAHTIKCTVCSGILLKWFLVEAVYVTLTTVLAQEWSGVKT